MKRAQGEAFSEGLIGLIAASPIAVVVSGVTSDHVGALCVALGVLGAACVGLLAGMSRRRFLFGGRVTREEFRRAGQGDLDPLVRDFLKVLARLATVPSQDAEADRSIRRAVRSLSLAMEKLPTQTTADRVLADPDALGVEAFSLAEQARREADGVVAASLERQAAALAQQAETVRRVAVLVRRNRVLRQEIAAQVKVFSIGLMAAEVGGRQMDADFAALAENVAQVAQEADALADARVELDTALGQSRTTSRQVTEATQIVQQVRR